MKTSSKFKMLPEAKETSNKTTSPRKRNKRSLFSVLFNSRSSSSGKNSLEQSQMDEDTDRKCSPLEPPQEKEEEPEKKEISDIQETNNNNYQQELETSKKSAGKSIDEDSDSYVLDLNDCVANERFKSLYEGTINHKQRILKSTSPNSVKSWHENENYIRPQRQLNRHSLHVEKTSLMSNSNPRTAIQRTRSPILEEFFEKHKLKYPSVDSGSPFNTSGGDEEGEEEEEEATSLPQYTYSSRQSSTKPNFTLIRHGKNNKGITIIRREDNSERDLRLINWKIQSNSRVFQNESTSSDSELDEYNIRSPALALTCSDDTSCSSVELIWTPRKRNTVAQQTEQKTLQQSLQPNSLSIFELAKPSRAKGKRFAQNSSSSQIKKLRDKVSPGKQWVENPIFTTTEDEEEPVATKTIEINHQSSLLTSKNNDPAGVTKTKCESPSLSSSLSRSISLSFSSGINEDEDYDEDEAFACRANIETKSQWSKSPLKRQWSIIKSRQSRARRRKSSTTSLDYQETDSAVMSKRDNIYLNHIIELDRRIKTNVSSIKSQLTSRISDTSKRASILADQLITSIKDTSKEQLQFASNLRTRATGTNKESPKDRSSSPSPIIDSSSERNNANDKTKLFSLIYKHQQQPNGQVVITKQPKATNPVVAFKSQFDKSNTLEQQPSNSTTSKPMETLEINTTKLEDRIKSECKQEDLIEVKEDNVRIEDDSKFNTKCIPVEKSDENKENTCANIELEIKSEIATNNANSKIKDNNSRFGAKSSESDNSCPTQTVRKGKKRLRRQINIAKESDDEEDQFYHKEYVKLRLNLDSEQSNLNSERRLSHIQLRSLNYWTRFRMRKLGIDWQLKPIQRSKSINF